MKYFLCVVLLFTSVLCRPEPQPNFNVISAATNGAVKELGHLANDVLTGEGKRTGGIPGVITPFLEGGQYAVANVVDGFQKIFCGDFAGAVNKAGTAAASLVKGAEVGINNGINTVTNIGVSIVDPLGAGARAFGEGIKNGLTRLAHLDPVGAIGNTGAAFTNAVSGAATGANNVIAGMTEIVTGGKPTK